MKRLKKTVPSKNTTRKKNNGGMTYVELLVALSLLVLIVTMFSPMLLSSYDRIYRAGEITSDAFDSRQDIENGLASREDHAVLGFEAKFSSNGGVLANKIYIMAKRIASSFDGLETLYVGGKGKIEIVNNENGLVKDNQSSQIVRLKLTNLAYKDYGVIDDVSQVDDFNKGKITALRGKMLFYICSIFDTKTALVGEVVRKPNFTPGSSFDPYCDLRIDNIDITKSPIEITAYYLNEYGSVKQAVTYLNIQQPDVIFVGETSDSAQYFTLSDAGSFDAAVPVIAGRKMETAPIPSGKTLTDVTFVNAMGPITEGYFSMCGEDGIARRLWHLTDSTASLVTALDGTAINNNDKLRITYKSESVLGSPPYYQYDWAGDLNDIMAFATGSGKEAVLGYSTASNADKTFGGDDHIWKNEYNVDNNYFVFNLDGYNAGHSELRYRHRRVSYALEATEAELAAAPYNAKKEDGYIIIKDSYAGAEYNRGDKTGDGQNNSFVYWFEGNQWCTYGKKFLINEINSVTAKGSEYGLWKLTDFSNENNAQVMEGAFEMRDRVAGGTVWGSNEEAWDDNDSGSFDELGYVYLQSYNTISPDALLSGSVTQANTDASKSKSKVDFTSVIARPGTYESLYLGTVDAYGIINETRSIIGTTGSSGWSNTDQGVIKSHVYITQNGKTYKQEYEQLSKDFDMSVLIKNGGNLANIGIEHKPFFGREQYSKERSDAGNSNVHTTWSTENNARFTLGYCSDLYSMYNNLRVRDERALEDVYLGSYPKNDTEKNDTDGDFRKNMWFPREFLNMTASDSYGTSLVTVGYDVGGRTKLYADVLPEFNTSTNARFLTMPDKIQKDGVWIDNPDDLDKDNDGRVDCLFGYNGNAPDLSRATVTAVKYKHPTDGKYYPVVVQSFSNKDGKDGFFIDPNPGYDGGNGNKSYISVPRSVVASTEVDYICNNGVISIYNANPDADDLNTQFTHIGYVKGSATENVRFTSVSVDMLQSTGNGNGVLGAAIGDCNGKLYLAKLTYTNGAIATTPLRMNSNLYKIADFGTYYSSIDTVKAFNHNGTFYILVGGKSANGTGTISLVTVNASAPASSTVTSVKFADTGFDITDIILADKYVCFTSHQSGAGSEGRVDIGELFTEAGEMINLDNVIWRFATRYHTEFESDAETGAIKAKGDGTPLPRLKALASSVPVDYS